MTLGPCMVLHSSFTMSLSCLPVELLHQILVFALLDNDRPTEVLSVHRTFFELGQPLLHTHLRFRSVGHLSSFARGTAALACAPQSLVISLAGGATGCEVFKHLKGALLRCRRSLRSNATMADGASHESEPVNTVDHRAAPPTQVPLELLSLRLNSHSRNPYFNYIFEALSLARYASRTSLSNYQQIHHPHLFALAPASPKVFVWEGPDPEHHFSFAVSTHTHTHTHTYLPYLNLPPRCPYYRASRSCPPRLTTSSVPLAPGRLSSTSRSPT